jgi:adenosine deaminase
MENRPSPQRAGFYRSLPKIELHRHLEGSLRLVTMAEVARTHEMEVGGTDILRPLVQIQEDEAFTFQNFLAKFGMLRQFFRSPELITRMTREAIEDAFADNIRYLELRFTPLALSRAGGFSMSEVMDWVVAESQKASKEYGITVRLIASVNRNESAQVAEAVASLAIDKMGKGIVAMDLAGNEAQFPITPFIGIFNEAKQAGLHMTIHAGEWGGAGNVAAAIIHMSAERIGHGVRVMEDPAVVALARERAIPFEVCVTSNYHSGVVSAVNAHPISQMIGIGLNVTINTDDPSICQITLGDEYQKVREQLGLSLTTLRERVLAAARAAFLPEGERQALISQMEKEFPV